MSYSLGTAQRIALAERVCGDAYAIVPEDGGVLIAVVDGLGHGEMAAEASEAFVKAVEEEPDLTVGEIIQRGHRGLSRTRGAAAAVVRVDTSRRKLYFSGVGNIHLHSVGSSRIAPVSAPGVLGHRVRKFLSFEYDLQPGTVIAIASDGISSRLHLESYAKLEAQDLADALMTEHGKSHDDATVVTLRVTGDD